MLDRKETATVQSKRGIVAGSLKVVLCLHLLVKFVFRSIPLSSPLYCVINFDNVSSVIPSPIHISTDILELGLGCRVERAHQPQQLYLEARNRV